MSWTMGASFSIGCGLIRMVLILLLVSYRAIRSGSSRPVEQQRQEVDYYANTHHRRGRTMLSEEDAEDILVPPPQYGSGTGDVEEKRLNTPRPHPPF
jgi:hypothetical protein